MPALAASVFPHSGHPAQWEGRKWTNSHPDHQGGTMGELPWEVPSIIPCITLLSLLPLAPATFLSTYKERSSQTDKRLDSVWLPGSCKWSLRQSSNSSGSYSMNSASRMQGGTSWLPGRSARFEAATARSREQLADRRNSSPGCESHLPPCSGRSSLKWGQQPQWGCSPVFFSTTDSPEAVPSHSMGKVLTTA